MLSEPILDANTSWKFSRMPKGLYLRCACVCLTAVRSQKFNHLKSQVDQEKVTFQLFCIKDDLHRINSYVPFDGLQCRLFSAECSLIFFIHIKKMFIAINRLLPLMESCSMGLAGLQTWLGSIFKEEVVPKLNCCMEKDCHVM